ncbi:unnamed protein product, partial [Nesidiocoris tenuis]
MPISSTDCPYTVSSHKINGVSRTPCPQPWTGRSSSFTRSPRMSMRKLNLNGNIPTLP